MNDIIKEATSANKENMYDSEIYSPQYRVDSDIESLEITMIQIRQIINVLNSEFFNSTDSLYGTSQASIKLYYELFQSIAKSLKPIEITVQNPNFLINTLNIKFEKLYFKFITDFIELLLAINLPKEVSNPICNYFSPLLVIFMRNLIDEKTNISQEDFTLLAQLNQGSFAVFESVLKSLFSNCFYKLDLIKEIIHDADEKGENKILIDSFEELKKSLIWTKEYANQSNTILHSIFSIRCEIISYKVNKVKLSTLLNEIETAAKKCILYDKVNKSLNEFLTLLNTGGQNIKISSFFVNCGQLQTFYEKVNKFQLLEIENLLNEGLISYEFAEEMKKILENIFDFKEITMLDKVISLVDEQLYNYHHQSPEDHDEEQDEEQSIKLKKLKKEEFDLNLQKMIPPSYYDQTIEIFLDYIRNPEISGDIPLTLKKDMMTLQLTEVISAFKKDKLNQPIKNPLNGLVNDLSFLVSKAVSINGIDGSIYNRKFSLFLSIYIATIKIFLIARENYKDSEEDFQPIYKTFCELIPPPSFILKMVNLNERFQSLQQASNYLMETAASTAKENGKEENANEEDDKQLNTEKVNIFGSNDAMSKLVFELDIASVVLSFIEKNKEFCEFIECTEFSTDLWNEDQCDESGENFIEENNVNASLSLFSLFNTEGFHFDISPVFFINWITFNFSTFNKNIQSMELIEFVPFCNYSEISGAMINSCTLVDLYSRVNNQESAKNLINAVESMKFSMLLVFTHHRLDEVLLTNQIQMCIKESRAFPSVFNKINVLCHTILTKICYYIKIFDFMKNARVLNPSKVCYIMPIETINYSIEILKKLKMISQSKIVPPEFLERIDDVGSKLASVVDNESNPLPFFFSQDIDQVVVKVYSILNEIRKVINTFDMTIISSQVSTYIDEILIYFETKQDESSENKFIFSSEAFNAILKLKNQVDELVFSNKIIYAEIAIIKMQLIIEKAESIFPRLDKPLEDLREMINICYAIFSIKTMLNFAYFTMSQYTKSGIVLENWFRGEFDENFIFCKEDESIDYQYTYIVECINSVVGGMTELQNKINSFATETELEQVSSNNKSYNQQMILLKNKIYRDIECSFQAVSNTLKAKLENLNNRKISPEIVQLEKECEELIQQFASYPNQSQNLPNIYKKINLKMLPSSNKIITQFESESLQLSLKSISIKEMEKKIAILQEELNKRQNQINQSIDSSVVDSRKKQRERSHQIIQLIKESILNLNNPIKDNDEKVNEVDSSEEISADDPNYQIIQKLKKQLSDLDEENLKLKNEIREIEFHHKLSREDQIDLLMNKSCNFPNPSISTVRNEKSSGISKKNSESLNKQVKELNESIEKMRNKIQTDKKQGSNETVMIKLLKDIRPRVFSEALLNEDTFKQVAKSTQEVAENVMKEWKALRAEIESVT